MLLGPYGSPESRAEYERVLGELRVGGTTGTTARAADLTMNELLAAFWPWADRHYRHPDGSPHVRAR